MKKEYEYLSDEELNKLIADIETEGLAVAPESIEQKVISFVDKKEARRSSGRSKKAEYYTYCFKVFGAVAAAILLLIISPMIRDPIDRFASREDLIHGEAVMSREDMIYQNADMSREEYLSQDKVADRDEFLKEYESDSIDKFQSVIESKISELQD